MSFNKVEAQSKKSLGSDKMADATRTNHILYGLLAVLIAIFIWKASSGDTSETMDIPKREISVPLPLNNDDEIAEKTLNPNIEVEIKEAAIPGKETLATSVSMEASSPANINKAKHTGLENGNAIQHYFSDTREIDEDYSYIFTNEVEMEQGTYRGLDPDGFAITKTSPFGERQYVTTYDINLTPIFEDRVGRSKIGIRKTPQRRTPQAAKAPVSVSKKEQPVATVTKVEEEKEKASETSNTLIHYGKVAHPLEEDLTLHPYESLPYLREEKENFVAEKVKTVPTPDDLEPHIHPSTLGDRDTRMGFGVVVRPNR